jgi:predicted metal-dependent phosphoesterase TrpH
VTTRPLSVVLLIAGLTLGSVAGSRVEQSAIRSPGPVVLAADLHVHALPGDGVLPAWELRREAARRGLDVIVITNHNQSIAARLPSGGQGGSTPIVIPGQEITSPRFHLVAAGVRRIVDWRLPMRQAIEAVQAQGGVAIAAHPVRESWRVHDEDALRLLDGVEALHAGAAPRSRGRYQLLQFYDRVRKINPTIAAIGSSDFHGIAPLGRSRTYIVVEEVSERGVLEAIRAGRTVASDTRGTLVGDPALVGVVEKAGLAAVQQSAASLTSFFSGLSVGMVLVGIAGLICFR